MPNEDGEENEVREIQVKFEKIGWGSKEDLNKVTATVPVRPGSDKNWVLSGKWNEGFSAFNEETGETIDIWKPTEPPENYEWMYFMPKFALDLNNLPDAFKDYLPPTDSRLRPDTRALEVGDFELAATEKHRLEQK